MDRILSDRAIKIIVVIIGIIVVLDIANVFVVGGPSVFALIFKPANPAAASGPSTSSGENGNLVSPISTPANAELQVSGSSSGAQAIYVPTKATPVPTVQYVSAVTPIQEEASESSLRYVQFPTQITEEEDAYVTIYANDLSYQTTGSPTAVALKVVEPPLVINFNVTPDMSSKYRVIDNRTGTKSKATTSFNVTRPSEFSWFTVTIYDKDTGKQIDQDGYGNLYDQLPQNTYTLRLAGNYLIQFNGENTEVHVDMSLKREGNIV